MFDVEDKYILAIQVYDEYGLYKDIEYAGRFKYKEVEKRFLFFKWKKLYKEFDEKASRHVAEGIALIHACEGKNVRIMKKFYLECLHIWADSEVIWENGDWK